MARAVNVLPHGEHEAPCRVADEAVVGSHCHGEHVAFTERGRACRRLHPGGSVLTPTVPVIAGADVTATEPVTGGAEVTATEPVTGGVLVTATDPLVTVTALTAGGLEVGAALAKR